MLVKTAEQYKDNIRALKRTVFYYGEVINNVVDFPLTSPHVNAAAECYAIAHDPVFEDLAVARSDLCDCTVNRFTYIHKSPKTW